MTTFLVPGQVTPLTMSSVWLIRGIKINILSMYNESLFSVSPSVQMSIKCIKRFNEQHSSNYHYSERFCIVNSSIRQMSVNWVTLNYSKYFYEQHSSNYHYSERFYTVNPSTRQMSRNWVTLNYSKCFNEQHPSVSSNFTQSDFEKIASIVWVLL